MIKKCLLLGMFVAFFCPASIAVSYHPIQIPNPEPTAVGREYLHNYSIPMPNPNRTKLGKKYLHEIFLPYFVGTIDLEHAAPTGRKRPHASNAEVKKEYPESFKAVALNNRKRDRKNIVYKEPLSSKFSISTFIPRTVNTAFIYLIDGASWENSGATTSVNLGGLNTNLYEASQQAVVAPWAGLGLGFGYQWFPYNNFLATLALEANYTRMISKAGIVRPFYFVNPAFDTLNYTYTIENIPVLLVSQLGWQVEKISPYFLVGLGVSWNRASQYNETPTDPNGTAAPMRAGFQKHTEGDFAYMLGFGLSYQLSLRCNFGLEYRYTNFGQASLNSTPIQTTTERLSLGVLHSNALFIRFNVAV